MMKVLWIVNIVFPEVLKLLNNNESLKSTGGWLLGGAEALSKIQDVELAVACVSLEVDDLKILKGDKILYYVIPLGKGNTRKNPEYRKYWRRINDDFNPDLVHIHGTEYSHGLAYIEECGTNHVVVSIQGLTSIYAHYYNSGLSLSDILGFVTPRDIIKGNLLYAQRLFKQRGEYEKELLGKTQHIIGRTLWDKAHAWAVNPTAHYHFCNEILRQEFYNGDTWSYHDCIKHSIFLSQAIYPLKGLHMVLKAMPIVLRHYPDTSIRIAGFDVTRRNEGIKGLVKLSTYGRLIRSMIKRYHLTDKIEFVGNLDAGEMKKEYLKANVFVCPSSIENSPNSLGEAQILGVPVVASCVGGIPDMMKGDEKHLYRFEDIEMLAYAICDVFANEGNQVDMKDIARNRHNREHNLNLTISIYDEILTDH